VRARSVRGADGCRAAGFRPSVAGLFDPDKMPPVSYLALPKQAASAEGFVPRDWLVEKRETGDLNDDGVADILLVLRQNDPKNVLSNKGGLGRNPMDTNPRMLAVAFGRTSGGYDLAMQNHTLIPRPDNPAQDDVLSENGGVSIVRGALRVALHRFMSAGGWGMGVTTFTLRYQNGRFELIGFDRDDTQRNTGETVKVSVNYSTGRMGRTVGSIEHDRTKTAWSTLPKRPLLSLDEVGDGLAFDPVK
jgi:hypothetical protein